jgi:hypothetical protein
VRETAEALGALSKDRDFGNTIHSFLLSVQRRTLEGDTKIIDLNDGPKLILSVLQRLSLVSRTKKA